MDVEGKTIAVSAQVDMDIRAALYTLAKAQKTRVSDLLRPVVMAAIESGEVPEEPPYDPRRGSVPVAVRVPLEAREALRQLAAAHGSVVSRVLRALVSKAVTDKGGVAK